MKYFPKLLSILLLVVAVVFCGCKSLARRENERHSQDLNEPHSNRL